MQNRTGLYDRSIEIIKKYQSPSGAYVASPNFGNYQYSWLRDGSFIAYAMDCVGEHESSRAFHLWVHETVCKYGHKVKRIEASLGKGINIPDRDFLHTRYRLDGTEDPEDSGWGNFQMDGYGTWLWAVSQHIKKSGDSDFFLD